MILPSVYLRTAPIHRGMGSSTARSGVYIHAIEDVIKKIRDEFVNNGGPGDAVLLEFEGELASQHQVQGFPTIKNIKVLLKLMVYYLKKQVGPASTEIKSAEDTSSLINENAITLNSKVTGKEADVIAAANTATEVALRLVRPGKKNFQVDAIEKFIEEASVPTVVLSTMTQVTTHSLPNSSTALILRLGYAIFELQYREV